MSHLEISKESLKFILKEIHKYFPSSEFDVFLFGSYAKKKATPYSDINIAIKGHSPLPPSQWQQVESALEESYLPQKVDLVDYQRVSPDFQKVIDKDGVKL